MSMLRPSFQFYPADWQANSNLRRCTHEEKGLWLDVLCLLHDQAEYGVCRWPLAEIAQAVGSTEQKLQGLIAKGVLKGAETGAITPLVYVPRSGRKNGDPVTLLDGESGPLWYSSRMVTDEYKRILRAEAGAAQSGSQDSSPKPSPKPPFGEAPKPTPEPTPEGAPDPSPFSCARVMRAGPSSSSSSSSSSSNKSTPNPADAGPAVQPRKKTETQAIALQTFIDNCAAQGERPLRDYSPLWTYAQGVGLHVDMVALAWAEFCRRFLPGGSQPGKRQKDWRATFRKYVENNYFKLWAIDRDGQYFLTSNGKQAAKFQEAKEAA